MDTLATLAAAGSLTRIMVMTVIPLADAKAHLSSVMDEVRDTHDRVVITRNGRPEVVMMSVDDLESIEETLAVLSTPGLSEKLDDAADEIEAGDYLTAGEIAAKYLGKKA